jgi:hypothetical protein
MAACERDPGPFPTNPDQAPRPTRSAPPKKRPRLPWAVAESPSLARTTAHAPRFRGPGGGFSSRMRKHWERLPVIARGVSSGWSLGRVSLKCFVRQASRFGYHGARTVGIGYQRRSQVAPQALVGADGAHTEAAALLRRRGQGGAAADGAKL